MNYTVFGDKMRLPHLIHDLINKEVLTDISYGDDQCASFALEFDDMTGNNVKLWVDFENVEDRQCDQYGRFIITKTIDDEISVLLDTDLIIEVVCFIQEYNN
jgi:hypothetical protein